MTKKLLNMALSTINVPSEMKVKSGTNEKTQGVSRYGFKFKNMCIADSVIKSFSPERVLLQLNSTKTKNLKKSTVLFNSPPSLLAW